MSGSVSGKTWLAIAVPIIAFLIEAAVWKGEISTRLSAVESLAKHNED